MTVTPQHPPDRGIKGLIAKPPVQPTPGSQPPGVSLRISPWRWVLAIHVQNDGQITVRRS
jgi:hypothetical protein